MKAKRHRLKLLLDEGVPDSVGHVFTEAGHEVIYGNKVLARGTPDQAVCVTAIKNEAILVALDGDMRQIAKSFGVGSGAFAKLSLIKLSCPEPEAAKRVRAVMSLLEHEWSLVDREHVRRLFIEIQSAVIRINR